MFSCLSLRSCVLHKPHQLQLRHFYSLTFACSTSEIHHPVYWGSMQWRLEMAKYPKTHFTSITNGNDRLKLITECNLKIFSRKNVVCSQICGWYIRIEPVRALLRILRSRTPVDNGGLAVTRVVCVRHHRLWMGWRHLLLNWTAGIASTVLRQPIGLWLYSRLAIFLYPMKLHMEVGLIQRMGPAGTNLIDCSWYDEETSITPHPVRCRNVPMSNYSISMYLWCYRSYNLQDASAQALEEDEKR